MPDAVSAAGRGDGGGMSRASAAACTFGFERRDERRTGTALPPTFGVATLPQWPVPPARPRPLPMVAMPLAGLCARAL